MNLSNLIAVKMNFEERLDDKLSIMITFFKDRLDNDSTEDIEAIKALADKIKHMIMYIGCPNSVEPMLRSIATRRIKHWQAHDNVETLDKKRYVYDSEKKQGKDVVVNKGFRKGKQLKNNNDLRRVYQEGLAPWYRKANLTPVISGHFRWNNRGYTLSREATDLLDNYLLMIF